MSRTPSSSTAVPGRRLVPYLLLAVFAGAAMPVQSRVNGALGLELGSPVAAALVSFVVGLALLVLLSTLVPRYRAAALSIIPVVRRGRFPRWYLGAGAVGGSIIISQAIAVPVVGVALFTVALVTGQTLGSLVVDRVGFALGRPRRISPLRLIGAVLTVAGVLWAISPRFNTGGSLTELLPPMAFALFIGVLMGFQAAANGVQAQEYGSPVAATLMNFIVGTLLLTLALAISRPAELGWHSLPEQWWYYIGGLLGVLFVVVSALLVRYLGVLVTGLAMIGGQLVGSLLLDIFLPTAGTVVLPGTIAGTILTLLAVSLASISGSPRSRKR